MALTNGVPRKIKPFEDPILSLRGNEPEPSKESNDSFSSTEIFHGYTADLIPDQARPQGPKPKNVTSQDSPMKRTRSNLDESKVYEFKGMKVISILNLFERLAFPNIVCVYEKGSIK